MPRGQPLHKEFARALRLLGPLDIAYAEAWRMLIPTAVRLGVPRPSYGSVREFLMDERLRRDRRQEAAIAPILADFLLLGKGGWPRVVEHKPSSAATRPRASAGSR